MSKRIVRIAMILMFTLLMAVDPSRVSALDVGDLVINEFLADPPSDLSGDANRDGVCDSSDDEFVEIVNVSGASMDISGWLLEVSATVRHTFPINTVLPSGCGIVVFGGGSPSGYFGDSIVQVASSGGLGLLNTGASISLKEGGTAVDFYTYSTGADQDQSLTREPELTGVFTLHSTVIGSNGAIFSPGTKVDGSLFLNGCSGSTATVYLPLVIR